MIREEQHVEVRPYSIEVYEDFAEAMRAAYPKWSGDLWRKETISRLIKLFPDGQLGVFVNDKLVGCALSIIVDLDKIGLDHDYRKVTGAYTFNTHTEKGDTLYGIEVFVHPEFRGKRLGRRLYEARKELCERLKLRAVMFGGRMPELSPLCRYAKAQGVHREGANEGIGPTPCSPFNSRTISTW